MIVKEDSMAELKYYNSDDKVVLEESFKVLRDEESGKYSTLFNDDTENHYSKIISNRIMNSVMINGSTSIVTCVRVTFKSLRPGINHPNLIFKIQGSEISVYSELPREVTMAC